MVMNTIINNKSVSIVLFVLEEQVLFCSIAINTIILNTKQIQNIYVFIENENTRLKILCNVINNTDNKLIFIIANVEDNSSIPKKVLLKRDSFKLYNILKHIKDQWVFLLDVGIMLQNNIFNIVEYVNINKPIYGIRGEPLKNYVSVDILNILGINPKDRGIDTRILLLNLDFCRIQNIFCRGFNFLV